MEAFISDELNESARRLAKLLGETAQRVVFAESCTAGLLSAVLSRVPGSSAYLCGSAVVYQEQTKSSWLSVPTRLFAERDAGVVSAETAEAMVLGVLKMTPQANWGASITGHLGPNAPPELDGIAWVGIGVRDASGVVFQGAHQLHLPVTSSDPVKTRLDRQQQAGAKLLDLLREAMQARA
jgi:PncC family amidohydrolase